MTLMHDALCERQYTPNRFVGCLCSLRRAKAQAWDEGHEEGCANPHGCPHLDENPYRPIPPALPIHRTEAGHPNCATCDGGGCLDCTDPA